MSASTSLTTAYRLGAAAARSRFKVAGSLGAEYGVAPSGPEVSHGTALYPNQPRVSSNTELEGAHDPAARARAEGATDWLWNLSTYDRMSPGSDSGYGQETIG